MASVSVGYQTSRSAQVFVSRFGPTPLQRRLSHLSIPVRGRINLCVVMGRGGVAQMEEEETEEN